MNKKLNGFLKDFETHRKEIELLMTHKTQLFNFATVLLIGFITVLLTFSEKIPDYRIIFLLFPIAYSPFGISSAHNQLLIIRNAHYINSYLRKKISKEINDYFFQWEIYKKNVHFSIFHKFYSHITSVF